MGASIKQLGFFDKTCRMDKLRKLGDSLERLNKVIDLKIFAKILNRVFAKEDKVIGGCLRY